jgi:hypothetical protein
MSTALEQARALSRELLGAAERGDAAAVAKLDAERMRLLVSFRHETRLLDARELALLREVADLNDRAVGLMEHGLRAKSRDLDMLSAGRRASRAYATTGPQRRLA